MFHVHAPWVSKSSQQLPPAHLHQWIWFRLSTAWFEDAATRTSRGILSLPCLLCFIVSIAGHKSDGNLGSHYIRHLQS